MENKNQQTFFSKYEFIKIILPGTYFIFLMILTTEIFDIYFFPFSEYQFIWPLILLGGTVVGLTLYSLDGSKKRRAFQLNQPSLYIQSRCKNILPNNPITEYEAEQLYFYLLNNFIPSVLHDKIFTFGMIFYVINTIRRITLWFCIGSIILIGFSFDSIFGFFSYKGFFVALLWVVYFINSTYNKADRKMQQNYEAQIMWLQMNHSIIDTTLKTYIKTKANE